MKPVRITLLATVFAFLTAVVPGRAEDFTGNFTGSYLAGWTTVNNDNPHVTVLSAALIDAVGLTMVGAKSGSPNPIQPFSSIDITHVVVGTGPTQIGFSSIYFGANLAHPGDSAAFLRNGVEVQDLSSSSALQAFSFTLNPGDVFGFRLTSDNDNNADFLQVLPVPVPEPGAAALTLVGGMLLAFARFRRCPRRPE